MSLFMDDIPGRYTQHVRPRTNTAASSLLTPMSEIGPSRYPGKQRESEMTRQKAFLPSLRTSQTYSGSPSTIRGERSARSPLEYGPEPFEEYCSPTRSATSGLNELLTRRPTKNHYEELEPSNQSSSIPASWDAASVSRTARSPRKAKNKKSPPAGYSFRNLVSVLTKGKHTVASSDGQRPSKNVYQKEELLHIATKNLTKEQIACITPTSLKSGPLLYLARGTRNVVSSPSLPVWTPTTAKLHEKHLLVTWETSHGNPSTRIIDLSSLVDACSLSLNEIGAEERSLLPTFSDMGRDLKVFEIQFNGKRSERFAAYSAEQRTGWIDAIWFAYRQSGAEPRDKFVNSKPPLTVKTDLPATYSSAQPASAVTSGAASTLRTHGSSIYSDRSLPPTPTKSSPSKQSGCSSSARSNVGSPRNTLRTPTRTQPGSQTLSVRDRDQRSVDKQRLEQIVQSSPFKSPTTTPISTATRPLSPSPAGDAMAGYNIQALWRNLASQPSTPLESLPLGKAESLRDLGVIQDSNPQDLHVVQATNPEASKCEDDVIPTDHLDAIRLQLGNIQQLLNSDPAEAPHGILQAIEAMQSQLSGGLPDVVNALESISVLRDRLAEIDWSQAPRSNLANTDTSQLIGISDKLDALMAMQETAMNSEAKQSVSAGVSEREERELQATQLAELQSQLAAINEAMKTGEARHIVSDEQQADFGRYLNELNCWLETFVNGGSSQIQVVASGVQRLCQELGCDPSANEHRNIGNGSDAPNGLIANVRQLLEESKEREEQTMALQASVNGLLAIVREDARQSAKSREKMTIEAVANLVDRQSKNQDQNLQALASTLTHEIRGEKIRFIDAMKEATEIKVQAHVEKFKKELTREVLVTMQDLGRLNREKQTLEEQIADLFAFLSKQKEKQGVETEAPHRRQSQPLRERAQNAAPMVVGAALNGRAQSQRRPLPNTLNPWNQ